MSKRKAIVPIMMLALATAGAIGSVAPVSARGGALSDLRERQSQVAGGDDMFRRHFFRGQAYHGAGYAAQVSELPHNGRARDVIPSAVEAMVEPGTPGAAVARAAAACSARFKSYDASTGTYTARGGVVRRCP